MIRNDRERTCMSYWWRRLVTDCRWVLMPRTELVGTTVELIDLLDGHTPTGFEGAATRAAS